MASYGNGFRAALITLVALIAFVCNASGAARAAEPVIFVNYGRSIGVFDEASGTPIRRMGLAPIAVFASSMATGTDGTLYLAIDNGNKGTNTIVHYDRTLTRRLFTYDFPSSATVLCLAVDQAEDVAAFGNSYPNDELYVYKRGVATADRIITLDRGFEAAAYASDGTLWVKQRYRESRYNEFDYIVPGSSSTIGTQLLSVPKLSGPAFTFGPDGGLLVMGPGAVINYEGKTGKALRFVPVAGTFEQYSDMKLSADGRTLYVLAGGYIYLFAYPAGGMPIAVFDVGAGAADLALGSL